MPLPSRVDAALLYEAGPEPDFTALAESIIAIMAPSGISLSVAQHKPGQGIRLQAPGLALTLACGRKRLAASRFAAAAASDYTRLQGLDPDALIAAHGGFLAIMAQASGSEAGSQDSFETLLALTQIAASQSAMSALPLCVHWGQSDQFFAPERFLAMADVLFPLPLFCHPRPFSSGRMAEGVQCMGVRLARAEQVLGRALVFREAPARLPYLLERAYAFIEHCRGSGRILGHGASFGASADEVIALAHLPASAEHPSGCIELTLREREGVFQLQPEGSANPAGLAEPRVGAASPPAQAPRSPGPDGQALAPAVAPAIALDRPA